ncbi:G-patch domain and KOW motifs-containing protein [Anopheles ziemanni]|uniref:G-patch domain and KOW motifs-containing protein n=2 Tax=coustani group TaxID=59130 RepID=UPI00265EDDBD|nr:G-patch domain and KOW motifs-containing protein [Anopheles ziemanni]
MDGKKISFGFSKVNKKQPLQSGPAASVPLKTKDDSIQLIECLEGQSIKVVGKTDEPPPPLVIPLREQDKTTVPDRLAKLLGIRQEKQGNTNGGSVGRETSEVKIKQEPSDGSSATVTETLEQRAAREILDDINQANVKKEEQNNFVVPLLPEELPLDGARESTMDDYESVPIEKFGLAMLRGMGYKDDPKKDTAKVEGPDFGPVMRPKGLGLGADRAIKAKAANALLIPPAQGEILTMKQGAQIKVLAGKHKDAYGTIQSIDEELSRVIVKYALGGAQESMNEYLVQVVSKEEYNKYARILNAAKYEEFKNREMGSKSEQVNDDDRAKSRKGESSRSERTNDRRQERVAPSVPPSERRSRERDRYDHRSHRDREESDKRNAVKSSDRSREQKKNHDQRERSSERSERRRRSPPLDGKSGGSSRRKESTRSTSGSDSERSKSDSDSDERRKHKKSSCSYVRTSSGTKKKSHKYKQRRERRDERDSSYDRRDRRRHGSDSESDDKHHKKKTKKSKKPRSRSRSRR